MGSDGICLFLIRLLLTMAVWVEQWRGWILGGGRRLQGSLRKVLRDWRTQHFLPAPKSVARRGGGGWNRTPRRVEQAIVRLHVEAPHLGAGQLGRLAQRVLGFRATRETFRRILLRNQGLLPEIELEQEERKRRIVVHAPRKLWGMDLTLVWVLGFFPVWVLGIVDYHGSRLVALEPLPWPTAAAVVGATERAFAAEGVPERVLTDRGAIFRSHAFEQMLSSRGITHTLTRPRHPWTNGRIERVFRTWKETIFAHYWLVPSLAQLTAICTDFVTFYNGHRPHSAYGGRTPDEVHAGRPVQPGHAGRIAFFGGRLLWWRFS
jgi:putative transposase